MEQCGNISVKRQLLQILFEEFKSPSTVIMSVVIGLTINLLQGGSFDGLLIPYVVSFFVQSFSKTSLRFKNRHIEPLLMLPTKRIDPAFVMCPDGNVLMTAGETKKLFKKHGILKLEHLLGIKSSSSLLTSLQNTTPGISPDVQESYCDKTEKWYQVKSLRMTKSNDILVWMDDISKRRSLDDRLKTINLFSEEIIDSIDDIIRDNDTYKRLAELIFGEGYGGVFIACEEGEILVGKVYKKNMGETIFSDEIAIHQEANVAIHRSRHESRIATETRGLDESQNDFEKRVGFDKRVKDFLGLPIQNFVNYHERDVSIIAFNKNSNIDPVDLSMIETVVNSAYTITQLVTTAEVNQQRFLQSITGLCAAAEFSDEITGKHILRVNKYSHFIANELGSDRNFQDWLSEVAAVHDIGKVAIPHIIKLDRKLSDEERSKMQMHTVIGANIIKQMIRQGNSQDQRLVMAYNIALNHHQHWDGSGYPGLKDASGVVVTPASQNPDDYKNLLPLAGDEIPLEARIVALADHYDALRGSRQYKPAFSHEKTCGIIRKDDRSGKMGADVFGQDLMEIFNAKHVAFADIYESMKD